MTLRIYQVDAFTNKLFGGNPAAICPLNKWLSDDILQQIAQENNLSETAFYVKDGDHYILRWFTSTVEVDLCGHATLAAAYVLFHQEKHVGDSLEFLSPRSGKLTVTKAGDLLLLNFPADEVEEIDMTDSIRDSFDKKPIAAFKGKTDILLLYEHENDVKQLIPNFNAINKLNARGVIATAKGNEVDFVSRFFAPQCGVDEDPVTGSAHTTLTPFWSKRLRKSELSAVQLSKRQGHLKCKYLAPRVEIGGHGRLYLVGTINIA